MAQATAPILDSTFSHIVWGATCPKLAKADIASLVHPCIPSGQPTLPT